MLSNKKAFFTGLLIAPILCLSLLGGLGAAQSKDALATYLQSTDNGTPPPNIIVPAPAPVCQSRAMDIVAHQDDDLLFMNPDVQRGLNHGNCVQTVYITAGDAGQGPDYWTQRENGAKAAYSTMLKQPNDWQDIAIKVNSQWLVHVVTLKQAPTISLVFVRLPDGNLYGEGFASTNFESLQKLEAGEISVMQTVDGQANYSLSDLTSLLSDLINQYQPDQIRTQADDYPDHSDHIAVSRLVSQAYKQFGANNITANPILLSFYNGYRIDVMPINVSGDELTQKQNAFLEYAKYDNAVCSNLDQCYNSFTYGGYFTRQYSSTL